jgi:hypothetical protein
MVRTLASISLLIACQTAAFAQGRPDTLRMSCGQAAGIVRQFGAIVLGTGPYIYDRYVASRAFCQRDEQTEPRWLATADTRQCFVGYGCERRYGDPANR